MINYYTTPKCQNFTIEGVKHISCEYLYKSFSKEKILILDIRENAEVMSLALNIDFVLNSPSSLFLAHLHKLPKHKNIVVMCAKGIRSTKIVDLLMHNGFNKVYNLDGGIFEWKNKNLPIKGFSQFLSASQKESNE